MFQHLSFRSYVFLFKAVVDILCLQSATDSQQLLLAEKELRETGLYAKLVDRVVNQI